MRKAKIYIDEFGAADLEVGKGGNASHFIYAGFVIPEDSVEQARHLRTQLAADFKLGPDIKSKNLGDRRYFDKRLRVLQRLVDELDFSVDVYVVDKKELNSEQGGLRFKQIFYKYFQKLFVAKYADLYQSFDIYADKIGDTFAVELQNFVREKASEIDLFHPDRTFQLVDDVQDEKLVQFADLLAGSLGRIFCASHANPRMNELYEILHTRLSVEYFPFTSQFLTRTTHPRDEKLDQSIRDLNYQVLQQFITQNEFKPQKNLEVRLLKFLALQNRVKPQRFIYLHEIVAYLGNFSNSLSKEAVRIMIRDLRYKGIFIVSHQGQAGYKLPSSYDDVVLYYRHLMSKAEPMLVKIKKFNDTLRAISTNEVNPLEKDPNFERIKNLVRQL